MTTMVCLPVDQEYFDISDEVYEIFQDPKAPKQSRKITRAAELLVGALLQVMIVDLVEQVKMKPFAKKIVKQLEGVIEKTANTLVNKVILKLSNKDLIPLVEYLRTLELEIDGIRYIAFQLEDFAEEALEQSRVALQEEDLKAARKEFHTAMQNFQEQGLYIFYKKPMGMIKLGMVAKKIVDLGYKAIQGAVKPAINKIVKGMDLDELETLEAYISTMTHKVD